MYKRVFFNSYPNGYKSKLIGIYNDYDIYEFYAVYHLIDWKTMHNVWRKERNREYIRNARVKYPWNN